jgi:hypothetical protein
MRSGTRVVIAAIFICAGSRVCAVPLSATFSATVDAANGQGYDADVSIAPTDRLTLNAGAGQSSGTGDSADLHGTLLNAGASLHGERRGVALTCDRFADRSNYQSTTLGARAWFSAGDFEVALLGRRRNMSVEMTLALPNRTLNRTVEFSAVGGGLQLSFDRGNFSAYAMGVTYDYNDDFTNFIELTQSPQLARRPRIEALVGSFVTQAQGAIDRQVGAGVEQTFGRHLLGVDLSSVRDAIDDTTSTSVALTWRYAQSARLSLSLSGGMVDSDRYGDIAFVGVSADISN